MITYRPARSGDLSAVSEIYRTALTDVYLRHGFPDETLLPQGANLFYAFILREEPEGFFVAEDAGRVIGATYSWVRGHLWFLSHLFILPEYQGRGVGKALLKKTLRHSAQKGITTRCVITMAFNTSSISLYMRNGMFPVQNILLFGVSGFHISPGCEDYSLAYAYADPASGDGDGLHAIDEEVLGFRRPAHHRYFTEDRRVPCLLFRNRSSDPIAYAYLWPDGRIGPVAATREAPFDVILSTAIREAQGRSPHLSMMIPGTNTGAVGTALKLGFTVKLSYILLSSCPFGSWGQYLFHSPGLM